jgi:hypothetical protein
LLYKYEVSNITENRLLVWETARSTSAAPTYFKSFVKANGSEYWDGGLFHNNPAKIATSEARRIWGDSLAQYPDVLLSIGSGYHSSTATGRGNNNLLWWERMSFSSTLGVLKRTFLQNMDSEAAWKENFQNLESIQPGRYVRFSPSFENPAPNLDDVSTLENGFLEIEAGKYIQRKEVSDRIDNLVQCLISTSFYFHLSDYPTVHNNGSITFSGLLNPSLPKCSSQIIGMFILI